MSERPTELIAEETLDSILGGALRLYQPRRGYRFSVEAVLLARFAAARPAARVLELGAGCGVVGLILAACARPREVVALEIQPALAALIERNAALNGLGMVRAVCADLRGRRALGAAPGGFDLVLANPPFRARASGRESPQASRRLARGEAAARLEDFTAAAARYARHGGRAAFVFAAARSAELISALRACSLEPKRIRFVHPNAAASASSVLVEARKGGGVEVEIEPPLVMYHAPAVYSDEARALLERL
jgi:tRNA1Val (adenine37-N6)-methyltransferase